MGMNSAFTAGREAVSEAKDLVATSSLVFKDGGG